VAGAITSLVTSPGRCLDVAGGTGIVSVEVADRVLVEAERVLRPGGSLVTTVDKELAHAATTAVRSDDDERIGDAVRRAGSAPRWISAFSAPSPWGSAGAGNPLFRVAAFRRRAGD
jgi:ubiquinone/menaquinone biosynthesis C-methylase UbiE